MKIGVDAYYLFAKKIDGLGNYLLRLVKELSLIDIKNNYFLYTPGIEQNDYADAIFSKQNFHLRIVKGILNGRRRLWLQSPSLRRRIIKDNIEMFFGGGEYFPLLLPKNIFVAATIHDVAFKVVPDAISIKNNIFYNFLLPLFVKRADMFFTVSNHSKEEILKYLDVGEKKIIVIYNGIDLIRFSPYKNKKKKNFLLFVGTLQPRKNLVNLIRAYSIIADKIKDKLVVVGAGGWKKSELKELIEGLDESTRNKIEFKGYISGNELAILYREAKLFALLSLHEGFCLPILEAMASGTAVLTAGSSAIPEIFQDSVEYADPISPEEIADKINYLLHDDKRRKELQGKGLKISKKYNVRTQAENYLRIINDIAIQINK